MGLLQQASLVITPNAVKAGKLYSVIPNNGAGDLDVVRATTGTRVNSAGLIETVGNNIARLDYSNGSCPSILVEPQRTNLLLNSQFNGAISGTPGTTPTSYTNIQNTGVLTVLSNSIGSKLQFTTNGTNARALHQSVSILANTTYVYSLKAEILTSSIFLQYMNVGIPSGATTQFVYNGTNVASDFPLPIGECNLQIIITNGSNAGSLILRLGSGIYGNTTGNIIIREPQLEVGSNATSYIPTTTSAVTRNADVISKTGISSLINSQEGVLFCEISALSNDITDRLISLTNGTSTERISIYYSSNSSNLIKGIIFVNAAIQCDFSYTSDDIKTNIKIALKYKENDFSLYVNGIKRATDNSGITFPANKLNKLSFDLGLPTITLPFNGNVKKIAVFPTALSDVELSQLTTL